MNTNTPKTLKELRDALGDFKEKRDAIEARSQQGLSDQDVEDHEKYNAEIRSLEGKIKVAELAEARRASNVNTGIAGNRDFSEKDKNDWSQFRLNDAIATLVEGRSLTGLAAEISAEGYRQANDSKLAVRGTGFALGELRGQTATGQTSSAGDQGGDLIPTGKLGLVEAFWSQSILPRVGATILTGLAGNVSIPIQDTKPTIQDRTEIQALTDQEILFSSVEMTPNRRGVTIPYSLQFLRQTSLSVEQFLRNQILNAFSTKADLEATNAIIAAVTTPGAIGGTDGGAPTYANLLALISAVEAADAANGQLSFLTNTKVRSKLMGTQKFSGTNGMAVWEDPNSLLGYNAVVSTTVPSNITKGSGTGLSAIIFGNFRDLYVGQWGVVEFVVDPYSKKKTAEVEVTANTFWDIKVVRAASFSTMEDAITTLS